MFYMISGGSGSGKSEYAENVAVKLQQAAKDKNLMYIATMMAFDKEAEEKIKRHRNMRKEKGFITKECYTGLKRIDLQKYGTILIDCMSNLAANEMFQEQGAKNETIEEIIKGIDILLKKCENLVVVTNEIFSDGCSYDDTTMEYMRYLGKINEEMAQRADKVVEVVCGIPVYHKGKMEGMYAKRKRFPV